jgi:hypothetical protein
MLEQVKRHLAPEILAKIQMLGTRILYLSCFLMGGLGRINRNPLFR